WLHQVEGVARCRWGRSAEIVLRARYRVRGHDLTDLDLFLDAVRKADLFVVTGAGALNDEYAGFAVTVLDLVDRFIHRGVPTAMMGQGVGPLTSAPLLRRSRDVLPRVGIIG